ncbi:MAG: hypothetical protein GQE15_21810 [Archangiaceae bacterium]|nr:hypothetical protein [Archangiaceae bacterium]
MKNPPRGASTEHQEAAATVLLDALAEPSLPPEERIAMVRLVLDLGYPWALRLQPEDLARVRSPARPRHGVHVAVMALLMALATFTITPRERVHHPTLIGRHGLDEPTTPALVQPEEPAPRRTVQTVRFDEEGVVSGARTPRVTRRLPRMVLGAELDRLLVLGEWERVIDRARDCRRADPLRLDCIAEEAAAHARLSQRPLPWQQPPRERALASLERLEHERAARALYRRYLSIAPSTDALAPKLVQRLREDGDWVEWNPEAADRELAAIITEPCLQHGCVEQHLALADAFEVRALRTHDEDDLAQVEDLRLVSEESPTCRGPLCRCARVVRDNF